jgi:hypothetical protein
MGIVFGGSPPQKPITMLPMTYNGVQIVILHLKLFSAIVLVFQRAVIKPFSVMNMKSHLASRAEYFCIQKVLATTTSVTSRIKPTILDFKRCK